VEYRHRSTIFLTSALGRGAWSRPHLGRSSPLDRPGTHCIGSWIGPRAGVDGWENLAPTGIRSPDGPSRSESLYRLSYSGPPREDLIKYVDIVDSNEKGLSF